MICTILEIKKVKKSIPIKVNLRLTFFLRSAPYCLLLSLSTCLHTIQFSTFYIIEYTEVDTVQLTTFFLNHLKTVIYSVIYNFL